MSDILGIDGNRRFISRFYPVKLSDDEVLNIVDYYKYYDIEPIKDIIANYNLLIGDILLIVKMCSVKACLDYVEEVGKISNDETVYASISQFIDNNTLAIFGDSCREEYGIYHFSTDEIADLLYFIDAIEEEDN